MQFDDRELVGYLASALVVASLAMTSVVRLRVISLAGSVAFVVYGVLIGSIPILITNVSIAALNVWFLSRELGGRRDLGAVIVPRDSPFLVDFLARHVGDIHTFQPSFETDVAADFALVLTRDGLPAGALLGDRVGSVLHISLDYVLPAYRDSRLGHWLFGPGAGVLRGAGIDAVTSPAGNEGHRSYLIKMGFDFDGDTHRFHRRV